jgi:hypothetical protein
MRDTRYVMREKCLPNLTVLRIKYHASRITYHASRILDDPRSSWQAAENRICHQDTKTQSRTKLVAGSGLIPSCLLAPWCLGGGKDVFQQPAKS